MVCSARGCGEIRKVNTGQKAVVSVFSNSALNTLDLNYRDGCGQARDVLCQQMVRCRLDGFGRKTLSPIGGVGVVTKVGADPVVVNNGINLTDECTICASWKGFANRTSSHHATCWENGVNSAVISRSSTNGDWLWRCSGNRLTR